MEVEDWEATASKMNSLGVQLTVVYVLFLPLTQTIG